MREIPNGCHHVLFPSISREISLLVTNGFSLGFQGKCAKRVFVLCKLLNHLMAIKWFFMSFFKGFHLVPPCGFPINFKWNSTQWSPNGFSIQNVS
jgi:hypothetical protein